jgi:6-phosphogluconolactonase
MPMNIQIYPDLETISREAADMFLQMSGKYIVDKGSFAVALSGGSTPKRFYELLGTEPYIRSIDWRHIHFFWADERCVPPDHADSNYRIAFDAFLSKINSPEENIHRIKGEEETVRAARDYEQDIRRFFSEGDFPVFDLIILGIGEDGHTASLFPGSQILKEEEHLAAFVAEKAQKHSRITLTLPVLNHAENILVLVSGENKATVVKKVVEERDPSLPASLLIKGKGQIFFFLDINSAQFLSR